MLKHGISEPPVAGRPVDPKTYRSWYENMLRREGKPFWPDAAWREVLFGVGMITVLFVLAWWIGPPKLSLPPDPTILHAYPRPDWYFAVLALIPPGLETYIIIFGPLLWGALLIILPFVANRGERSSRRRPWAMGIILIAWLIIVSFWVEGARAPWSPDFTAPVLPVRVVGAATGPVARGAVLFHDKGCEYCHAVAGFGGHRGPDLTDVGDRLTPDEMTIRIVNGATNMPSFGGILTSQDLKDLVAFLQSRKSSR